MYEPGVNNFINPAVFGKLIENQVGGPKLGFHINLTATKDNELGTV
jgi:hypothetical protein